MISLQEYYIIKYGKDVEEQPGTFSVVNEEGQLLLSCPNIAIPKEIVKEYEAFMQKETEVYKQDLYEFQQKQRRRTLDLLNRIVPQLSDLEKPKTIKESMLEKQLEELNQEFRESSTSLEEIAFDVDDCSDSCPYVAKSKRMSRYFKSLKALRSFSLYLSRILLPIALIAICISSIIKP